MIAAMRRTQARVRFVMGSALLCMAACSGPPRADLARIYNRAAMDHGPERNPIIVIPGILGSRLEAPDGEVVWGAFSGRFADPETERGARLVALPMREGAPLRDLRDEVRATTVLENLEVSLVGLPLRLDAYRHVLRVLGVGGYRDATLARAGNVDYGDLHYTCFQFEYDWRRDLVENAKLFAAYLERRRDEVQKEHEQRFGKAKKPLRFDVVAHSMGGLLVRYFLRYGTDDLAETGELRPTWKGAEWIDRVVLVGTPNHGSLHALTELVFGVDYSFLTPRYAPAVLGTMPAVYQLLPRARHGALRLEGASESAPTVDPLDPDTWIQRSWGLADPREDATLAWLLPDAKTKEERRRIALDHLKKCLARARRLHEALDVPAQAPAGTELYLFSGDAMATPAGATCRADGSFLKVRSHEPGDGTVLRSSALGDERVGAAWMAELASPIHWSGVHFLFTDHLAMTKDPGFVDNVLYRLLEAPRAKPAR